METKEIIERRHQIGKQIMVLSHEISELNKFLMSDEACAMMPNKKGVDPLTPYYDRVDALSKQRDALRKETKELFDQLNGFQVPDETVDGRIFSLVIDLPV